MLPAFLCRLFGPNWRTSASMVVAAVAGFVATSPELFHDWPMVLSLAKYIAFGGLVSAGFTGADAKNVKRIDSKLA